MSELTVGTLSGLAANDYKIEVASGSQLVQPGSVLQVVSTTKDNHFGTASASYTDITGLSATITPSSTASKVLVFFDIQASHSLAQYTSFFNLVRNTTNIAQGVDGSSDNATSVTREVDNYVMGNVTGNYLDSPASTSALTYKIQVKTVGATLYINRLGNSAGACLVSSITLMEIAG